MRKHPFAPVRDYQVKPGAVGEMLRRMSSSGGFQASLLGRAPGVLARMWNEKDCLSILSFTADIIATGARGVIRQMVRDRLFDLIVTTCGALDHDIARTFSEYLEGDFSMDDVELLEKGYHRLGNVLVPREAYGPAIERFMQPMLSKRYPEKSVAVPPHMLIWEAGKALKDKDSILYWAWKNRVPVIVPGITDGAFGSQLWLYHQSHRGFNLDMMADEQLLSDSVFGSKRVGALMLGGGISKHHTIWWAQFRGGLDYAVYVTTATEFDGSLSGAQLREAISWGKVKPRARHVTIIGDVTIILPLLASAALGRT
jgi:deoxyhypusine synthase